MWSKARRSDRRNDSFHPENGFSYRLLRNIKGELNQTVLWAYRKYQGGTAHMVEVPGTWCGSRYNEVAQMRLDERKLNAMRLFVDLRHGRARTIMDFAPGKSVRFYDVAPNERKEIFDDRFVWIAFTTARPQFRVLKAYLRDPEYETNVYVHDFELKRLSYMRTRDIQKGPGVWTKVRLGTPPEHL